MFGVPLAQLGQEAAKKNGKNAAEARQALTVLKTVVNRTDGSTLLVGGGFDNGSVGAAWVFTRSGGIWTQQGAKLVGSGSSGASSQGWYVALSADGNTAVVNGYLTPAATWVWTKSRGAWPQQGIRLDCPDTVGDGYQAHSAALSADGNTIIVGRGIDNDLVGAAWIFVSSSPRHRTVNH